VSAAEHKGTLTAATGKNGVAQATAWIAEGHDLANGTDVHALLRSLVALNGSTGPSIEATRRVARMAVDSDLDTAAVLFRLEQVNWPERFRRALDLLALRSPNRTLAQLTAGSVAAAQRDEPFVIRALCAIAGVSYRDVRDRIEEPLPPEAEGVWSPSQITAFFDAIDQIVNGLTLTEIPGATPVRALDLFPEADSPPGVKGWRGVEEKRRNGVSYEVLLAQREAGSAWLAHRNATSGKVGHVVAAALCAELDSNGVEYRRSSDVGGDTRPGDIEYLAGHKSVGVVALNGRSRPACGVVFAVARDGGTARTSAGRTLPVAQAARVPVTLVLSGPGWAERNETSAPDTLSLPPRDAITSLAGVPLRVSLPDVPTMVAGLCELG
jgi:hypothetical protein